LGEKVRLRTAEVRSRDVGRWRVRINSKLIHLIILLILSIIYPTPSLASNELQIHKKNFSLYKGNLILNGNTVYIIENTIFQIEGDIIVRDGAKLIIKNSFIKMISRYRASCKIAVYDEAVVDIVNSHVLKESPVLGAIHLLVQGRKAKLNLYNSSIQDIQLQASHGSIIYVKNSSIECLFYSMGSSNVTIVNSQVGIWPGYIALKLPDTDEELVNLKFEGLRTGNIQELNITYRLHYFVLENVNVTAWVIDIENGFKGDIIIEDSNIKEILPHFPYCQLIVKNVRPGFFKLWQLSDFVEGKGIPWNLTLVNTTVEERWKFIFQKNTIAYINNSTLKIDVWEGSKVFIKNSYVRMMEVGDDVYVRLENSILDESLQFLVESKDFTIEFRNSTFSNAFMEMASERGLIKGTVNIFNIEKVNFAKGFIIREYPLIVTDENGMPAKNVALKLINPEGMLLWSGTTDSEGKAIFNITFTKENYQKEWKLIAAVYNGTLSQKIGFLTDTPIVFHIPQPPQIISARPNDRVFLNTSTIRFTANVSGSVEGVILVVEAEEYEMHFNEETGLYEASLSLSDGIYKWYVRAEGLLGRVDETPTYTLFVDNTVPTVEIMEPPQGAMLRGIVSITITGSDANLEAIKLYINGVLVVTWAESGTYTYSWNTATYSDGTYVIKLVAVDKAGNYAEHSIGVMVDNTAPTIGKPFIAPKGPKVMKEVTIYVGIDDSLAGVEEAVLYYKVVSEEGWKQVEMIFEDGLWRATIPGRLEGATIQYYIEAVDKAGNKVRTHTYSYTIAMRRIYVGVGVAIATTVAAIIVIITRKRTYPHAFKLRVLLVQCILPMLLWKFSVLIFPHIHV